jgi:hypothetical protein
MMQCIAPSPPGLARSLVQPVPVTPVAAPPAANNPNTMSLLADRVSATPVHAVQLEVALLVPEGVAPESTAMVPRVDAASHIYPCVPAIPLARVIAIDVLPLTELTQYHRSTQPSPAAPPAGVGLGCVHVVLHAAAATLEIELDDPEIIPATSKLPDPVDVTVTVQVVVPHEVLSLTCVSDHVAQLGQAESNANARISQRSTTASIQYQTSYRKTGRVELRPQERFAVRCNRSEVALQHWQAWYSAERIVCAESR